MQEMPEKDVGLWLNLLSMLREHGAAGVLAFALSYVRIMYDAREPSPLRRLIEATLGGLLVLVVGVTAEAFGLSSGWSYFGAGFVGLLGVDQVRNLAAKWAHRTAEQRNR